MSSIVCNCTIADDYILELYWPNTVSFLCLCCLDINRRLQISFGDLVALVPATRALNNARNFLSLAELIFDDFMSLLLNYSLKYSTCRLVRKSSKVNTYFPVKIEIKPHWDFWFSILVVLNTYMLQYCELKMKMWNSFKFRRQSKKSPPLAPLLLQYFKIHFS